jgi:hypothetical protein
MPVAFPVNYRLLGDVIVFRTGPGTKLRAALDQRVVGFQVDRIERANRRRVMRAGPRNLEHLSGRRSQPAPG